MCGSRRIERCNIKEAAYSGARPTTISIEMCHACGERYYDMAAMQALEKARRSNGRKKRSG
jgi:hypothetical protein